MYSFAPFLSFLAVSFLFPLDFVLCCAAEVSTTSSTLDLIHHRSIVQYRSHYGDISRLHHHGRDIRRNDDRDLNSTPIVIEKRDGNARLTRYKAGRGACGGVNTDSDFIVALNAPQWDGGSHCYKTVTITYSGKTASAQIVDECLGCPPNALDLSDGLFAFFDDPSLGVLYGEWTFDGAQAESSPTAKTVAKTATASSATSHMATKTLTTPSSVTSSIHTSSNVASSSSAAVSSTASVIAENTMNETGFLEQVNRLMVNIGGVILQAPGTADRG
ncbi:RlpA-like double-psi beta-barrel-protein domain-containing protein-containing protein [Crucibulum laeve]|uniref:RlpA-like double-psi beta-barrel-protein domain-containing protein-containing protein n=1 Tax=Crucibulum laeve TaxID=68775 RepID=A0A5C3MBE8_9AGAR|nr:RlpA-like double-psi beta-barrel-protein domain-containing protein-containing protein [Crucibulum laeve]